MTISFLDFFNNLISMPSLLVKVSLTVGKENFEITHKCAFINTIETRLIPIQENSSLTQNRIDKC